MSSHPSPERLPLSSPDLAAERLARLRDLLPGAFAEGKLVPEKLAELVGAKALSATPERYGLSYAGRAEALREMLATSHGTLRPDRDASENWDTTENLIIEGDNLHVLKLLQSAYAGAVKLIYIDPPYNTGKDFVYPDDFRAGLRHYKELTQQTLSTNAETSGRYHSDWLKMMHPRLALARNLLRDDGVIFVSIDDHEVHNLRLLMDEVFGEENFVAAIIWQRRDTPANDVQGFSVMHEHVLCYARTAERSELGLFERTAEQIEVYKNPDNDPRGVWTRSALTRPGETEKDHYAIPNKTGRLIFPPKGTSWRVSRSTLDRLVSEDRVWWGSTGDGDMPFQKRFLSEVKAGVVPTTWWDYKFAGSMRNAKTELRALFDDNPPFDYPKPASLLARILSIATKASEGDLILDFFAGSGTTGQAVLELNRQDSGNRKFILVQFPEPTGREDFKTIADITRERVRRVIARRPPQSQLALRSPEPGARSPEPGARSPEPGARKAFALIRWTPRTSNFGTRTLCRVMPPCSRNSSN